MWSRISSMARRIIHRATRLCFHHAPLNLSAKLLKPSMISSRVSGSRVSYSRYAASPVSTRTSLPGQLVALITARGTGVGRWRLAGDVLHVLGCHPVQIVECPDVQR